MKLSKSIKILIGLATALNMTAPLLGIAVWFMAVFSAALGTSSYSGDPTWLILAIFFVFLPLIFLSGLSSLILLPVYLIHIIKNTQGKDTYRILSAIGLHFLPWVAMPFYFFVYIWPEDLPEWAVVGSTTMPPIVTYNPEEEPIVKEELAPEPEPASKPGPIDELESASPVEATVVGWGEPGTPVVEAEAPVVEASEPVQDEPAAVEAPIEVPAAEEDQNPDTASLSDAASPVDAGATIIHAKVPAVSTPAEEQEEEKPVKKPRRKRAAKSQSEPAVEDTPANPDATIIGPSPIEKETSDED